MPIKNHIIKAIQENKTIVMGTQQTEELIVYLIVSLKVDKKKTDRKALLRELKHLKTGYVKASADEDMAVAYLQSIEKKLGYHA